jgi:hypothetical protein
VTGGTLHGRDVADDVFCEWLLSDHPDARAERDWRRTAHLPGGDRPGGSSPRLGWRDQRPARRAAHVAGPGRLHPTAGRPDRGRAEARRAEPDEADVTRLRPRHETSVQISGPPGSWDYR